MAVICKILFNVRTLIHEHLASFYKWALHGFIFSKKKKSFGISQMVIKYKNSPAQMNR